MRIDEKIICTQYRSMKMKECYETSSLDSPKVFVKSSLEKTARGLTVLLWKRLVEDSTSNLDVSLEKRAAW